MLRCPSAEKAESCSISVGLEEHLQECRVSFPPHPALEGFSPRAVCWVPGCEGRLHTLLPGALSLSRAGM